MGKISCRIRTSRQYKIKIQVQDISRAHKRITSSRLRHSNTWPSGPISITNSRQNKHHAPASWPVIYNKFWKTLRIFNAKLRTRNSLFEGARPDPSRSRLQMVKAQVEISSSPINLQVSLKPSQAEVRAIDLDRHQIQACLQSEMMWPKWNPGSQT